MSDARYSVHTLPAMGFVHIKTQLGYGVCRAYLKRTGHGSAYDTNYGDRWFSGLEKPE